MSTQKPDDPDNLRTEYTALATYFSTVITFRITTAGLLLAAVGLIFGGTPSISKYFILMVITFLAFLIELRNRSLAGNLSRRAEQIAHDHWGYTG